MAHDPLHEERPWGSFTVLENASTDKVKRIVVHPGQRLSYQLHRRRSEHWVVVAGTEDDYGRAAPTDG